MYKPSSDRYEARYIWNRRNSALQLMCSRHSWVSYSRYGADSLFFHNFLCCFMLLSNSSESFWVIHRKLVQYNSVFEPSNCPVHPPVSANLIHPAPHSIECIFCHYCKLGILQNILDYVSSLAQHHVPPMEFWITFLNNESAFHSLFDFPFANPS